MIFKILDCDGSEIRPRNGVVQIPPSEADWTLVPERMTFASVYIKVGKASIRLAPVERGFQLPPRYRRYGVGRLDLFEDQKCTQLLGHVTVQPQTIDEADFRFMVDDLRQLAADATSPFTFGLDTMESSLGELEVFLRRLVKWLEDNSTIIESDIAPQVQNLPLHQALRRIPSPRIISQPLSKPTVRSLCRLRTGTGPKTRFLATFSEEVIQFTEVQLESHGTTLTGEVCDSPTERKTISSIRSSLVYLKNFAARHLDKSSNPTSSSEVLLDPSISSVQKGWLHFRNTWRSPDRDDGSKRFAEELALHDYKGSRLGIAPTTLLYERWFAALLFNGLISRGFLLAESSRSFYSHFQFVNSPFGADIRMIDGYRDQPITMQKLYSKDPIKVQIWIEPWVSRAAETTRYSFSTKPIDHAKHPDLLIKTSLGDVDHWAAFDCKFLLSNTIRVEQSSLRLKYRRNLGVDSCWIIVPQGEIGVNWSRIRNPDGHLSTRALQLNQDVLRGIFKAIPETRQTLTLFLFRFFEQALRVTSVCWGCGDHGTALQDGNVYFCQRCRFGWYVERCNSCRSPFITSIRGQSLRNLNPRIYDDVRHFYCPCGEKGRFVPNETYENYSRKVDSVLQAHYH